MSNTRAQTAMELTAVVVLVFVFSLIVAFSFEQSPFFFLNTDVQTKQYFSSLPVGIYAMSTNQTHVHVALVNNLLEPVNVTQFVLQNQQMEFESLEILPGEIGIISSPLHVQARRYAFTIAMEYTLIDSDYPVFYSSQGIEYVI
ncbi:MAG: hypothetical protein ACMXYF_04015 [Candidatus Woesearchaeota archaeon]